MIFIISLCAFFASLLTLFSDFGLGTLLMPIIAIFFPVTIAIALTAFVHLLNNVFKLILLKKNINWSVTFKFGFPALIAAIPGAWLLTVLSHFSPMASYSFFHMTAKVELVKIIIGFLLMVFATLELHPMTKGSLFNSKWLPLGGVISGFFGGLSGQQGAFRSPFLLHAGLNKEQFVSTNASIAVLVDIARLFIYGITFKHLYDNQLNPIFLITVVAAAFLGSFIGAVWLKKITMTLVQNLVATLLYLLGILLIAGII